MFEARNSASRADLDQRLLSLSQGAGGHRWNEFGYDPFGFRLADARTALTVASWLYRHYFRVEVFGSIRDGLPPGRLLLCANHSGQLPFDALAIIMALFLDHEPPRLPRAMVEKLIPRLPFVSYLFARWGQIVGTPENCRRLLLDEEAILVFPEGVRGISKPFTRRYQLTPFGHGFMHLATQTGAPIVPVAVIGAEEQAPAVDIAWLARLLGLPSFPLLLVPPFVPLPLPVKYRIHFGEPMYFPADEDDSEEGVERKVRAVRNSVQTLIHIGRKERKHVFF
jgi:1-acyl-sn-glycerol-3-phosphate acyltransferase